MAVTINLTVAQLAGAIQVGDGTTDPQEPDLSDLTRLLAQAKGEVIDFVDGRIRDNKTIPPETLEMAVIRICGYLYDSPTTGYTSNYFAKSGAKALLAPYLKIGIGKVQ